MGENVALSSWRAFFVSPYWRSKRYLVSPFWDIALAGFAAMLYMLWVLVLMPQATFLNGTFLGNIQAATTFAFLSYLVNYPHFTASYGIMYVGFGKKVRHLMQTNRLFAWRYVFAGVVVPLVMVVAYVYAGFMQSQAVFGWTVLAMFFFVGWHYAKQAFGVMMVLTSLRNIRFSARERMLMYVNVHVVWASSWLNAYKVIPGEGIDRMGSGEFQFVGTRVMIAPEILTGATYCVYLYMGLVVGMWLLKWVREGVRMPTAAVCGYGSVYFLLLWHQQTPLWLIATPFFHCAQYLLFVFALRRGASLQLLERHGVAAQREVKLANWLFVVAIVLAGIVGFELLPTQMRIWFAGTSFFMPYVAAFTMFINIHHYFIDNVIWKRDSREVWEQLFYAPIKKPA